MNEIFQSYFGSLVENLGINGKFISEELVSNESVTEIIKKFQNHPSIIKIHSFFLKRILCRQKPWFWQKI